MALLLALGAVALPGCAPEGPPPKEQLNVGYQQLDRKEYDQASATAESFLKKHPSGPGSAEAYYLEGRVYEQRAQTQDTAAARSNLDAARTAYQKGLSQIPLPLEVDALLHSGLANVAYHQDDYGTAVREWQLAYPHLQNADARAWVLYRTGLCQQRLGWFAQADKSFADVAKGFPNTEPAARAATHEKMTGFFVQVGSFSDQANADRAVKALKQQGLAGSRYLESGHAGQVVRIGPLPTYAEARLVKARVAGEFPNAVVQP